MDRMDVVDRARRQVFSVMALGIVMTWLDFSRLGFGWDMDLLINFAGYGLLAWGADRLRHHSNAFFFVMMIALAQMVRCVVLYVGYRFDTSNLTTFLAASFGVALFDALFELALAWFLLTALAEMFTAGGLDREASKCGRVRFYLFALLGVILLRVIAAFGGSAVVTLVNLVSIVLSIGLMALVVFRLRAAERHFGSPIEPVGEEAVIDLTDDASTAAPPVSPVEATEGSIG